MTTVFSAQILGSVYDFNFYVMDKKNSMLYLYCLRAFVLKVVKLQVISSCSEQNIFIMVDKMFQHISVLLSRLIDRLFTNLLNINITEGIKFSDDEEFRIFKLKLAD